MYRLRLHFKFKNIFVKKLQMQEDTISSFQVEGDCNLLVANGNDGEDQFDYIYEYDGDGNFVYSCGVDNDGNAVTDCLPTGNDNINSVYLQCISECEETCFGDSCETLQTYGYTCEFLEIAGCNCSGCTCTEICENTGTGDDQKISCQEKEEYKSACDEASGFFCGYDEDNWTVYSPNGCVKEEYLCDGYEDCIDGRDDFASYTTCKDSGK